MQEAIVFGVGSMFYKFEKDIITNYKIVGLLDNDSTKNGSTINGLTVGTPDNFTLSNYEIIITSARFAQIAKQLLKMGVVPSKINLSYIKKEYNPNDVFIENGNIIFEYAGIKAVIESPDDIYIFREILEYKNYNIGLTNNSIILDIGMNKGIASMYFAANDKVAAIYSFEPIQEVYGKALHNFSINKKAFSNKIFAFNYGLGSKTESKILPVVNLYNTGWNSTSTISPFVFGDEILHDVSVEIKDVYEEVKKIAEEKLKNKIICKIDTEGSEYEILNRLDKTGIINEIDVFIIEYHLTAQGHTQEFLMDIFHKNKYYYFVLGSVIHAVKGQIEN